MRTHCVLNAYEANDYFRRLSLADKNTISPGAELIKSPNVRNNIWANFFLYLQVTQPNATFGGKKYILKDLED